MMGNQISNTVLMTGAGFTKNFGGFLANEMWAKIFNCHEVQKDSVLKNILLNDFDYESIYNKIFDVDYSKDKKEAINTAVWKAYRKLDGISCNYIPVTDKSKSEILNGTKKIIDYLTKEWAQINFFFTLNQDLFIERLISDTKKPISSPGINKRIINHSNFLKPNECITLPTHNVLDTTKDAITLSHKELHYIKLHGSFGWKASDGSNKFVIGKNKEDQISKEPLLSWYFNNLFKQVLFQRERKLLIIGYSFRDNHINKVIAEAINQYGLKLYILSPTDPSKFKSELRKASQAYGDQMFSGISGYFQINFKGLFPPDGNDTDSWRELRDTFFND